MSRFYGRWSLDARALRSHKSGRRQDQMRRLDFVVMPTNMDRSLGPRISGLNPHKFFTRPDLDLCQFIDKLISSFGSDCKSWLSVIKNCFEKNFLITWGYCSKSKTISLNKLAERTRNTQIKYLCCRCCLRNTIYLSKDRSLQNHNFPNSIEEKPRAVAKFFIK